MRLSLALAVLLIATSVLAKKKKKSEKSLFDGKTLNCLVCRSLVDEIEAKINKVDPAKKVEVGTFRLNGDGTQNRKLVRVLKVESVLAYNFNDLDSLCSVPGALVGSDRNSLQWV